MRNRVPVFPLPHYECIPGMSTDRCSQFPVGRQLPVHPLSLHKLQSVIPGPISTKPRPIVPIADAISRSSSSHRTGCVRCSTAFRFASSPVVIRLPVTFEKIGIAGSWKGTSFKTAENSFAAPRINGEWNGPATASRMIRFAPASLHSFSAISSPSAVPDTTVCIGLLRFAAKTMPFCGSE